MSPTPKPTNRIVPILVVVFMLVFAGMLAKTYWPALTGQGSTQSTSETGHGEESAKTGDDHSTDAMVDDEHATVHAVLEVTSGPIEISFRPDLAPKHVEQLTTLISQGFYDDIVFHRVIDGFMAQTGDPTGTGSGSSELPDLPAEFSDVPFDRGMIGMARSANPDSANSQFFIMLDDAHSLNGDYTIIGKVVSGMEHVDAIKKGEQSQNGAVTDPDKIISFRLAD